MSAPGNSRVDEIRHIPLPAKLGIYARRGGAGDPAWSLSVRNPKKLGTVHATATIEEL